MEGSSSEEDVGSNELLLGATREEGEEEAEDDDEQRKKDLQEAEESIQLLIDVLEENDQSNSGEGRKRGIKERGQSMYDSNTANKPSASYTDDANDNNIHSAMGSAPDLKLLIPDSSMIQSNAGYINTSTKRPETGMIVTRDKLRLKLLKKHRSENGRVICGIVILLIMLGLGGSLIGLAWLLSVEDLFLLGGIFLGGGLIFTIVFILARCKARDEIAVTDYSVLYKT